MTLDIRATLWESQMCRAERMGAGETLIRAKHSWNPEKSEEEHQNPPAVQYLMFKPQKMDAELNQVHGVL